MPSRHLVDPEITPLIERLPKFTMSAQALPQAREMMRAMVAARPAPDADLIVSQSWAKGRYGAPDVRVIITAPRTSGGNRPCILHIHGGGYVRGVAEMTSETDGLYARELGAVVASVDYRLAPETPHPGPLEDCYAALAWLQANAAALGVDSSRLAVTGESAGGGLAAALTLLARERTEVSIAFQHLVFPMLDDRTVIQTDPSPYLGQFVWSRESNRFGWAALLGMDPGGDGVSPLAAPGRETDLSNLPPTFIACGALDLFVEESLDYARRLLRAGVPTEMHIYPGAPHGFIFAPEAQISRSFTRDSLAALSKALRPTASG